MGFTEQKMTEDDISKKDANIKTIASILTDILKKSSLVLIILALWQILPTKGIIKPSIMPPFLQVFEVWMELIFTGDLMPDIFISMRRVLSGFSLGLLFGIPVGIAVGYFKTVSDFFSPLIYICRQIPALALFPVFILFFGIGETSKAVIVFWVSVWPVLINTISGVRYFDLLLIKTARSMGADSKRILSSVILPGIVPSMMTGIRLGAGSAIISLVAAEMIGSKAGLGFEVINAQYNFQIAKMYAVILTIAVLGVIVNHILVLIEKKLTFWQQTI
ncbi:MAG: ABC transporter permease [Synergistaceae bacterium]|nr:ABC transporter permease [Synergistaceae bacterium]